MLMMRQCLLLLIFVNGLLILLRLFSHRDQPNLLIQTLIVKIVGGNPEPSLRDRRPPLAQILDVLLTTDILTHLFGSIGLRAEATKTAIGYEADSVGLGWRVWWFNVVLVLLLEIEVHIVTGLRVEAFAVEVRGVQLVGCVPDVPDFV